MLKPSWMLRSRASLNESPSEKEGKCPRGHRGAASHPNPLNESPSVKEGIFQFSLLSHFLHITLNESPSEKEGKFSPAALARRCWRALNESPSEKEGK